MTCTNPVILCMVFSTLEWQHSLQIQFSCFGREKAVSDTRPGAWYEPQHFVHLHSVKTDRFHKNDEKGKDEPTTRSFNGNCGNNNVTGKKRKK